MEAAIIQAADKLKYSPLKEEQKRCIEEFLKGRDVFVILPTGYGKSVCYSCIPSAYDIYHHTTGSIIIVVSPLTALIQDQVGALTKHGIATGYVDAESDKEVKDNVNNGKYCIVFMSPELLVGKMRSIFGNPVYQKRLIGLIIDEAHCVIKW